jgi:DNA end-binding protein Ku
MSRAIWKGSISFGLVNIPVGLFSAEKPNELSLRQLDRRDLSPIGYRRYNKRTEKEVANDEIVKGYEYEDDHYVVLTDEDLRKANPERTQTVEITDFVELSEIPPVFYHTPYYLGPLKKNHKGYALLREAMHRAGKVGIAKVVIRSREYLSAVVPQGDLLVLELLRYPAEVRPANDLDLPSGDLDELGISAKELTMAERLIEGMTGEWEPDKYHDEYRDDLMALIQSRVDAGETAASSADDGDKKPAKGGADVIDIMTLLKRSVEATAAPEPRRAAAKSAKPKPKPKPAARPAKPRERQRKSA